MTYTVKTSTLQTNNIQLKNFITQETDVENGLAPKFPCQKVISSSKVPATVCGTEKLNKTLLCEDCHAAFKAVEMGNLQKSEGETNKATLWNRITGYASKHPKITAGIGVMAGAAVLTGIAGAAYSAGFAIGQKNQPSQTSQSNPKNDPLLSHFAPPSDPTISQFISPPMTDKALCKLKLAYDKSDVKFTNGTDCPDNFLCRNVQEGEDFLFIKAEDGGMKTIGNTSQLVDFTENADFGTAAYFFRHYQNKPLYHLQPKKSDFAIISNYNLEKSCHIKACAPVRGKEYRLYFSTVTGREILPIDTEEGNEFPTKIYFGAPEDKSTNKIQDYSSQCNTLYTKQEKGNKLIDCKKMQTQCENI